MSRTVERASKWMYRGIWGVLTSWFRVPEQPPDLPSVSGEPLQSFRPSAGFLRYLRFQFWLTVLLLGSLLVIIWVVLMATVPAVTIWLTPVFLIIGIVPALVAYLAIHLRFDSTWYVFSRRSLRIRSGIWVINEATITFENIQNVTVESGPIERFFGIGNVIVDTAGGSQGAKDGHGKSMPNFHRGEIGGVANAAEIREWILQRLRQSRSAGLGDDVSPPGTGWSAEHVAALREIRDALKDSVPG